MQYQPSDAYVITLDNQTLTGDFTQIYPPWVVAGDGATGWQRYPVQGIIYNCSVHQVTAQGGILELWDYAGATNTSTTVTFAEIAAASGGANPDAKLLWRQGFKGDTGNAKATLTTLGIPYTFGLVARYINNTDSIIEVNFATQGGYKKVYKPG